MATTDDSLVAEYITLFESLFIDNCCGIAIPAFLGFEYLVTFDREVELFWKRKFTGASVLFLLNRYLPLLTVILDLSQSTPMSDRRYADICFVRIGAVDRIHSCASFVKLTAIVSVLQYIPWAAFSTLRAFALSARHRFLTTFLIFTLSVVPIVVNYARYRWLTAVNNSIYGCVNQLALPSHLAQNVLLLLNTLHLTFAMLSYNEAFVNVSYVTIFTEPVTAVLVSRFLLDLQETNQVVSDDASDMRLSTDINISGVNFAPIIGSLGSTVSGGSVTFHTDRTGESADEENASAAIAMEVVQKLDS
ncbi:uncharacterized protein TRAVEDRAFT_47807 [Trametes versicolor FP-101664 SS1]|uniref:uncharacterized protein n=1 Tax=Trametes versicolor (strain FP-101664) TaxID=717944 RepID=UPI0004621ECA|nr:uncharacterized protein TRAVEDRAFT_47807 [Trametes versicolor FP-101664 SS1]EIW58665.1 hypothetical protein TRAVEDRAFT_47807 [Trametes versicolor FP-101664 SS1]